MIIFAEQDITRDPPFSRIDFLCCRNLLIYMTRKLQHRILRLFHYALRPGGLLMLGPSEHAQYTKTLFEPLDSKWKIYSCGEASVQSSGREDTGRALSEKYRNDREAGTLHKTDDDPRIAEAVNFLLKTFSPPAVAVEEDGEVIFIHGHTDTFLEPAPGSGRRNILDMCREGLGPVLGTALSEARSAGPEGVIRKARVRTDRGYVHLHLSVRRTGRPETGKGFFLVIFEPAAENPESEAIATPIDDTAGPAGRRIAELEQELLAVRQRLWNMADDCETSNEELQSANEELQSSNEELETSSEELQSLNEELATVNTELENKVRELSRANDDMQNLLNSTGIAMLFLDTELNIRRFTAGVDRFVRVIQSDQGRALADLTTAFRGDVLIDEASGVIDTMTPCERDIQMKDGTWVFLRIRPYRTDNNAVDGLCITFLDIDTEKRDELARNRLRHFFQNIFDTFHNPVLVLNGDLKVIKANRRFYETFKTGATETENHHIYELGSGEWNQDRLRALLETVIPSREMVEEYRLTAELPGIGTRSFSVNARRLSINGIDDMILMVIEERKVQSK
jgi:two-component system CheB/CheR fusion protein